VQAGRERGLLVGQVERALVGADQRGQLGQDEIGDRVEVALAGQHPAEAGLVGLEPVLLRVLLRGITQVCDHLVDVVLEVGQLARGLHRDRPGQVALGHRRGHLGDGAHLRGQVVGQLVDVVGQVAPGAGRARHPGLSAQPALDADLARHRGDLVGEGGQGVDHRVDGVGQRGDLPPGLERELAVEVAARDRRDHPGDAAHLVGQVGRHRVHALGQVLPGAGHALDVRLAAQPALAADLARDPGDLGRERAQLVDHGVDGVLELEDLPLDVDRDLLAEVAARHRGGDLGDVAHLIGQVGGHRVDRVGQVLPGAGHALDHRLAAQPPVGADLARHPRHLGRERGQLVHHAVDDLGGAQEVAAQRLPLSLQVHLLRQVARRDRADHARHLRGRVGQLGDERVQRLDRRAPAAACAAHRRALAQPAGLADHLLHALELPAQPLA
jgi:hypothetical protein